MSYFASTAWIAGQYPAGGGTMPPVPSTGSPMKAAMVSGPSARISSSSFAAQKRVSLRIVALDIPPQDVITRDNVSVKVNAVLYMRVTDPAKAVITIEDYLYATSQLAQTTLRSVLGEVELDELLSDREKINAVLKKIIDERTDLWGIEVSAVEVKDVDLPDQMKRAMARHGSDSARR